MKTTTTWNTAGTTGPDVQAPGGTYLVPESEFPADLTVLAAADLHVLHSRANRQLDREYLSIEGPSLETQIRCHELAAALDACENTISGGTCADNPPVQKTR